ncbi:hypothetical protein BDV25DRAFT_154008, partial [Aspergillus avenaceus]
MLSRGCGVLLIMFDCGVKGTIYKQAYYLSSSFRIYRLEIRCRHWLETWTQIMNGLQLCKTFQVSKLLLAFRLM